MELLRKRLERLQRHDQGIMAASQLAAEFGDGEEPPEEIQVNGIVHRKLTKRERQVAKDARQSKRNAPVYLEMAQRRFEAVQRIEADRPPSITINAHAIQFVKGNVETTQKYEAIDVSPEESK
jgi:hypothetical protein